MTQTLDINTMSDRDYRNREQRARRQASRQGLAVMKSRTRVVEALDYGNYWLVRVTGAGKCWRSREQVCGGEFGLTLDELETTLSDGYQVS